jgi:hypothetical protein
MARYIPKPYAGRVVLCFADRKSSGWSERILTNGGVKAYTIEGSRHDNIVKEPYAGIWARHLNLCLRELQAGKEDKR